MVVHKCKPHELQWMFQHITLTNPRLSAWIMRQSNLLLYVKLLHPIVSQDLPSQTLLSDMTFLKEKTKKKAVKEESAVKNESGCYSGCIVLPYRSFKTG